MISVASKNTNNGAIPDTRLLESVLGPLTGAEETVAGGGAGGGAVSLGVVVLVLAAVVATADVEVLLLGGGPQLAGATRIRKHAKRIRFNLGEGQLVLLHKISSLSTEHNSCAVFFDIRRQVARVATVAAFRAG